MKWTHWATLVTIFGLTLIGCSSDDGSDPTIGSESHFLEQCEATRDCAAGLACHCGICTTSCADDETCSERGPAMCAPAEELEEGCAESVSWAGGLCLGECSSDGDCEAEMICSESGWCQRRELPAGRDDSCEVTLEATPAYVDYTESHASAPSLSQGKIYFSRSVADEAGDGSMEAFSVDAQSHEQVRLTASSEHDYVRTAAGGKVVLADLAAEPSPIISILDATTGVREDHEIDGHVLFFEPWNTEATSPIFDGDRLLYSDGRVLIVMSVDDWSVLATDELPELMLSTRPTLTPQGFAYSAYFEIDDANPYTGSAIYHYSDGAEQQARALTDHSEGHRDPFADGDDLYWRSNEAVYVAKDGADPERIHEDYCSSPNASGGRAVFACSTTDAVGGTTFNAIYAYDGTSTREVVVLDEETFIRAPRIGEHGVVWFEFLESQGVCNPNGTGRLMYYDLEYDELVELDQVRAPCSCCDRMDPPLVLEIEGDVVAWSFATGEGQTMSNGRFGYATIQRSASCPE